VGSSQANSLTYDAKYEPTAAKPRAFLVRENWELEMYGDDGVEDSERDSIPVQTCMRGLVWSHCTVLCIWGSSSLPSRLIVLQSAVQFRAQDGRASPFSLPAVVGWFCHVW